MTKCRPVIGAASLLLTVGTFGTDNTVSAQEPGQRLGLSAGGYAGGSAARWI